MRFHKFTTVFTPEEDDSEVYNVSVPALPEIHTFGCSFEEARFMAQDAMELVILSKLEQGDSIPVDKKPVKIKKNEKVEEMEINSLLFPGILK
ncbi:MAG: hypothetical protein UV73_C0001G0249 [Candidatus Gottesmanbacteria bacterium GW2011_GWA2_43_14]|uniref:HicB-like antitoxin of toxin-antitoxin system domain-containing protein n=1 Tax=Candidatus Gottesmanbacteria bacterium GW2011_GWA2_43_14 TaxID=1618443 RepID=A0A0G1GIY5_9BACT|nr:MAG: hypothetical protein UV73_C0001G0249 [Candidatus Gottesmanbacteria bacterium GW2011_GWA2_43_14]